MLPRAPSIKKSVEWGVVRVWFCRTVQKGAVTVNVMFQAEELPAGVSCLDTCLAHVDRDALSLTRTEKKYEHKTQSKTYIVVLLKKKLIVNIN